MTPTTSSKQPLLKEAPSCEIGGMNQKNHSPSTFKRNIPVACEAFSSIHVILAGDPPPPKKKKRKEKSMLSGNSGENFWKSGGVRCCRPVPAARVLSPLDGFAKLSNDVSKRDPQTQYASPLHELLAELRAFRVEFLPGGGCFQEAFTSFQLTGTLNYKQAGGARPPRPPPPSHQTHTHTQQQHTHNNTDPLTLR